MKIIWIDFTVEISQWQGWHGNVKLVAQKVSPSC